MTCENTGKNCGYSTWHEQRLEIAKIVIKYLETKIPEILQVLEEKLEHGDEDEESHYINDVVKIPTIDLKYHIEKLQDKFIKPFNQAKSDDCKFRVVEHPEIYHLKEVLCYFGVYGIHLLLRQGDCGGLYTVGEAHDILLMLDTIKPYFDTSSEIYETVYTIESVFSSPIYNVFKDSVTTLQPIRIT
mgnify:CR=1 FL=1